MLVALAKYIVLEEIKFQYITFSMNSADWIQSCLRDNFKGILSNNAKTAKFNSGSKVSI